MRRSQLNSRAEAIKEKMRREFRRGYGAGGDDVKRMNLVDIERVVNGDLNKVIIVYSQYHGGVYASESYLEGWAQAIKDASKGVSEENKTPIN